MTTIVQWSKQNANQFHIVSPPAISGITTGPDEAIGLVAQCLTERGYTPNLVGEYVVAATKAEVSKLHLAQYTCTERYPPDERWLKPLGVRQKERMYVYLTQVEIPCLTRHGYVVDAIPTQAGYIRAFDGADGFWAQDHLLDERSRRPVLLDSAHARSLRSTCHAYPPSSNVFG